MDSPTRFFTSIFFLNEPTWAPDWPVNIVSLLVKNSHSYSNIKFENLTPRGIRPRGEKNFHQNMTLHCLIQWFLSESISSRYDFQMSKVYHFRFLFVSLQSEMKRNRNRFAYFSLRFAKLIKHFSFTLASFRFTFSILASFRYWGTTKTRLLHRCWLAVTIPHHFSSSLTLPHHSSPFLPIPPHFYSSLTIYSSPSLIPHHL